MRIALIGCSKTKRYTHNRRVGGRVLPADLYVGDLFRKSVVHAEDRGVPWFVLSARFGLWPSNLELNPGDYDAATKLWSAYDETIDGMSSAEKACWHTKVAWDIINQLWEPWNQGQMDGPVNPKDFVVEIHAGKNYTHPLSGILRSVGCRVELPLEGLQIGERLAWYKSKEVGRIAAMAS